MNQYTYSEFTKILNSNGFKLVRQKGSHCIYTNFLGIHISVPRKLKSIIVNRLIKEYKLKVNV